MPDIHPTAIIEAGAEIADDAAVGPYSQVGGAVRLAPRTRLHGHVVIGGSTTIGEGTEIFPFASVGLAPQDKKYQGEHSRLEIGRDCVIREHVTINPGTEGGGLVTTIGDGCLLMVGAHVAHDCRIGNQVILVNSSMLAGHCVVGDHAIVGGLSGIHQFVRIGEHAFIGGMSAVENDVIPFGSAIGNRAYLGGLNIVGLKRRGFSREAIHRLRRAYQLLFAPQGTLRERLSQVSADFADDENVQKIVTFLAEGGERAVCTPRAGRDA